MKYDFHTILNRSNHNFIAVDGMPAYAESCDSVNTKIPMWIADMSFPTAPCILDTIKRRLDMPNLGYFDLPDAYYESILKWHAERKPLNGLTKEMISYENGVLGGVSSFIQAFTSPGEKIFFHAPTYVGFLHVLENIGRIPCTSNLYLDENSIWQIDYEDMEKTLKENNIHFAVFCSPHNPCGRVWTEEEINRCMDLFKKYDCIVISDEIWSDIIMPGYKHVPTQNISQDARNRTVSFYSPSKTFSLAGLVGSYSIACNPYLKDRLVRQGNMTHYNSPNTLSVAAHIGAYSKDGSEWCGEMICTIQTNFDFACSYIKENLPFIRVMKPQGTYMLFLDCSEYMNHCTLSFQQLFQCGIEKGVIWQNGKSFLWENSIRVVKIFLCVSPEEQARRFISRIDTPKKNWKFSSGDIDERAYWDEYMDAYETCINKTARKHAPWYVVPADHKWYARLIISRIVLNELKSMDPKWPELEEDEKANLQEYRALLESQIGPEEPEEDDGKKLKPSDTAVGIALKKDRQALSEKKFRKQLEKSVFQNFSDRFGVSDQTRDVLGKAYLDIEEAEAKAEADDLDAVKQVYQSRKDALKQELCGCGKEARKLLVHYKKASKARIDAFVEEINLGYAAFEEDLKRFMVEYELEVSAEDACAEDAAKAYCEKLDAAYEAHRSALADSRAQTEQNLNEIAEEYREIAKGFRTHSENEEEPAAAEVEAAEEVPAEDTEITENVETPAQNADPA